MAKADAYRASCSIWEGGFAAFNCKLRAELRLVLEQMSSRFSDDLSELNSQLYEGDSQDA